MQLQDRRRIPANGEPPKNIIVFLHGYGADGADLLGLSDYWFGALPSTLFVAPDAPYPCEMLSFGRQWFGLQNREPQALLEGTKDAALHLNLYLDELLKEHGMAEKQMALVGFSQGAMMALYVGVRRANELAGIVGYSGALIAPHLLNNEAKNKPPILLAHGTNDEIVPFPAMRQAEEALRANGFNVQSVARSGLGHSIDDGGLQAGGQFLVRLLASQTTN